MLDLFMMEKKNMLCSKTRFKKGHIPWNKGLNKFDHPQIMFYSKRMKENNPIYKINQQKENNFNWKGGKSRCIDCNKRLTNYYKNIRCYDCFRKYYKGDKHHAWKGGISKSPYPFNFNKQLKEYIKNRDGNICRICKKEGINNTKLLSIHHIDYNKNNLDESNLITLCRKHNSKLNSNREYWKHYIKSCYYAGFTV